jgi:hypothetical protein
MRRFTHLTGRILGLLVDLCAVGAGDIFLSLGQSFPSMYPCAGTMPMHLASDYIHPTPCGGRCRIRIYRPEDERDSPEVICSELPNNEGSSVTYSAH